MNAIIPAYVSVGWTAKRLGLPLSTFYARRPRLEAEGFPKPDALVRKYLRADVEAWLSSRRKVRPDDTVKPVDPIDFDAL